ncbi:hypothetical protein, partial [Kineococcus sp. SYSU DK005]|uniref:hypothetical protein n=1 Tax=Kineococcus sp. SYSU DK005 TaxID=3383126 RepID=UPI003D7EFEAD
NLRLRGHQEIGAQNPWAIGDTASVVDFIAQSLTRSTGRPVQPQDVSITSVFALAPPRTGRV